MLSNRHKVQANMRLTLVARNLYEYQALILQLCVFQFHLHQQTEIERCFLASYLMKSHT